MSQTSRRSALEDLALLASPCLCSGSRCCSESTLGTAGACCPPHTAAGRAVTVLLGVRAGGLLVCVCRLLLLLLVLERLQGCLLLLQHVCVVLLVVTFRDESVRRKER